MTNRAPRIFISAGEPSGDMHGAAVALALKQRYPGATLVGLGGDQMAAAGVRLLAHTRDLAVMGLFEVLKHLPFFLDLWERVTTEIDNGYDLVIPLDYPGFNLRLARYAKRRRTRVLYYIAPQVWAWHRSRMQQLAQNVDRLAVVLPFEETLFREAGANAHFVGHPLLDRPKLVQSRAQFTQSLGIDPDHYILALFPGSRLQEIERQLDLFVATARLCVAAEPNVQPVIAAAPDAPAGLLSATGLPFTDDIPSLLQHARAALVKSGTTTLETGLARVPMVITYQMHPLTFLIARELVDVPHVGLINLIAGERIVPELIQDEATPQSLSQALLPLIRDGAARDTTLAALADVQKKLALGDDRTAAERVTDLAAELLGR